MSLPVESAVKIVKENMAEICTVQEWASEMKFNCPKYFSRTFRNHYMKRPKEKLIQLKMEKFFELIKEEPEISCYEIALEIGLRDEIALNRFIKRHTGKPPTKWKKG